MTDLGGMVPLSQGHSLSQQGVWASLEHPNPKKSSLRTTIFLCEELLKMSISSIYLNFSSQNNSYDIV